MLEVYAGQVPHPFASSLAQELFESGLIPADTDFRIFRDYGNISERCNVYHWTALCGSWWDARYTWGKYTRGGARGGARGAAVLARGWWAARAWCDALLRSSFLPFLWTLPALGDVAAHAGRAGGAGRGCAWGVAAALPALQTAYLALGAVRMFVPVMGRSGTLPVPPDVSCHL
ncbi:unnamed protein product [Leptidea sinapis]|uniref:Uncharacterized protein n=1 Tax=Leptidea sinapis TaxID=189913 RepID=A0A5E4QJS7_9NEOP|nr:unnamed protein product [Leptidea sinapis]